MNIYVIHGIPSVQKNFWLWGFILYYGYIWTLYLWGLFGFLSGMCVRTKHIVHWEKSRENFGKILYVFKKNPLLIGFECTIKADWKIILVFWLYDIYKIVVLDCYSKKNFHSNTMDSERGSCIILGGWKQWIRAYSLLATKWLGCSNILTYLNKCTVICKKRDTVCGDNTGYSDYPIL